MLYTLMTWVFLSTRELDSWEQDGNENKRNSLTCTRSHNKRDLGYYTWCIHITLQCIMYTNQVLIIVYTHTIYLKKIIPQRWDVVWCKNSECTLTQNENVTLFIMGFTISDAGNEIQSCVGMVNFISWGVSL